MPGIWRRRTDARGNEPHRAVEIFFGAVRTAPSPLERSLGRALAIPPSTPRGDVLQEVFNFDEGPVILTFPAHLSADNNADLKDHLGLFLRKAKRQADKAYGTAVRTRSGRRMKEAANRGGPYFSHPSALRNQHSCIGLQVTPVNRLRCPPSPIVSYRNIQAPTIVANTIAPAKIIRLSILAPKAN